MPASKVLETLLVCTCSAQSALSNDINDDFVCDKVEKKSCCVRRRVFEIKPILGKSVFFILFLNFILPSILLLTN